MSHERFKEYEVFCKGQRGRIEKRTTIQSKTWEDAVKKAKNFSVMLGCKFSHIKQL